MKRDSKRHSQLAVVFLILWFLSSAIAAALYALKPQAMMIMALCSFYALGNFIANLVLSHAYLIAAKFLGEDYQGNQHHRHARQEDEG